MQNNALRGFGIAITRPVDQAKKLSVLIQEAGGRAISFPMINIVSITDFTTFDHVIADLNTYDWAIFISSNAVQNAMPRVLSQYTSLPEQLSFAAIGPVTAQALNAFGVTQVRIPSHRFDSESLLALPEMRHMQDKKVMLFRGVGGRDLLADTLIHRGATVTFAECYQRINPQNDCIKLADLWQNQQCHAIVVTSSEAMQHLLTMTQQGQDAWIRQVKICVNHARIADQALALGLNVFVADAPGDAAMLTCLQKALNTL